MDLAPKAGSIDPACYKTGRNAYLWLFLVFACVLLKVVLLLIGSLASVLAFGPNTIVLDVILAPLTLPLWAIGNTYFFFGLGFGVGRIASILMVLVIGALVMRRFLRTQANQERAHQIVALDMERRSSYSSVSSSPRYFTLRLRSRPLHQRSAGCRHRPTGAGVRTERRHHCA